MNLRRVDRRHVLAALAVLTAFGLLARFAVLGGRVFHWDEARVGYWTLRYLETGVWEYRPIVHGPVLFHVNAFLFETVGTSDAIARSVVALVGGLLPLSAYLFRSRLSNSEVILFGLILAVEPVLLYYGRFMRNDVLAAGFALVALGFLLRFIDTRHEWNLYAAVPGLVLALGTKEIALVYVGVWLGALLLLLDHRLFVAREEGTTWLAVTEPLAKRLIRGLKGYRWPITFALAEFLLLVVLLFAPRPELYQALAAPGKLPGVVHAATVESARALFGQWIAGGHEHSYVAFLGEALLTTATVSLPLVFFAVFGFLADRYTGDRPRDLVSFAFYIGITIYLLYPAITDISAPWSLVHAFVPLAIPAAVGLRIFLDWGLDAWDTEDWIGIALVAIVLLSVVGQVGFTAYDTSYRAPQDDDNPLVQYGQPAGDLRPTLMDIDAVAQSNTGTDVVFYGDHFAVTDESVADQYPANSNWLNRLPLAWYLERSGATTASATSPNGLPENPPVVIARVEHYGELADHLEGYDSRTYELTSHGTETVVFLDPSALDNPRT
ncbi:membrane-bound mannosyltransferase [Halodesulfurarchaeum formicicum]|uniref:Membrane-bound mannosyltransferase n=1 Tax=Halodesulfurarchaeum formicicum TaxID=1873524 RepID=A0A1D8S4U1_9EURY|nr:flippase activity-associated protein Agl23 [Halodesulfurarchaeum formicicum]AOW80365.1 membrane-bound mannosyltransferase [Halodesulfurarchaeum formicicum]